MNHIFEIYAGYNFIFVPVMIVIMGIGHLTHADYYCNIKSEITSVFWSINFTLVGLISIVYLLISTIPDNTTKDTTRFIINTSGVAYLVIYVLVLVLSVTLGYNKLYTYFGKKRHKL